MKHEKQLLTFQVFQLCPLVSTNQWATTAGGPLVTGENKYQVTTGYQPLLEYQPLLGFQTQSSWSTDIQSQEIPPSHRTLEATNTLFTLYLGFDENEMMKQNDTIGQFSLKNQSSSVQVLLAQMQPEILQDDLASVQLTKPNQQVISDYYTLE